jgi:hypothetical protein
MICTVLMGLSSQSHSHFPAVKNIWQNNRWSQREFEVKKCGQNRLLFNAIGKTDQKIKIQLNSRRCPIARNLDIISTA